MTPFDPDAPATEPSEDEPADLDERFPHPRLLGYDQDDSWLLEEIDGWRPAD